MTIAFLFVALLLLVGVVLRQNIPVFRWLYIPASVIAGFAGLAFLIYFQQAADGVWADELGAVLSSWPGWLIAVVFAGMLLERKQKSNDESVSRVARQGIMVWVIVLGETAIGLLATWLLIKPFYDVPNSIGMLIETGFAGGHGTAAAMGEVFADPQIGLAGSKDLGMLMATFGLVYGIVTGILWINLGVRKGWIEKSALEKKPAKDPEGEPIGHAKVSSETIDPLLLQVIWLALAFGVGVLAQWFVMWRAGILDAWLASGDQVQGAHLELAERVSVSNVVDFPLFIFTLFGGLLVRKILAMFGREGLIDNRTISRLTAAAMDILVVAAIASLNLSVIAKLAVPFAILFVCGAIWTAICLLLIARWILPKEYWFQLGLINYGMSTGTTATGFVLLRMVDPELKSGAAQDYALAAPLSAPFVGGGMITIALPLLVLERVPIALPALVIAGCVIALTFAGCFLARTSK